MLSSLACTFDIVRVTISMLDVTRISIILSLGSRYYNHAPVLLLYFQDPTAVLRSMSVPQPHVNSTVPVLILLTATTVTAVVDCLALTVASH